jgi:hypothetical protein
MKVTVRGTIDLNAIVKKIVDEVTDDLYDELKSRTPRDTGRAAEGWQRNKSRRVNTITNQVPYISELDKGSSSQAPNGITGPAIEQIRANASSGKYKKRK